MKKPTIFVSCGQRLASEKELGTEICKLISSTGNLETFFAEDQHDLNGLHENIMNALNKSVGFVAVMHPRGDVVLPDTGKKLLSRASVWIEQEIAIAAYINRTRGDALKTAVYRHVDVGLEGMRELLHLNPREFSANEEVLEHLRKVIPHWTFDDSKDVAGELSLTSRPSYAAHIGKVYELKPVFRNDGPRANQWSCTLSIPEVLMKPWSGVVYGLATNAMKPGYKSFTMTEANRSSEPILHAQTYEFMSIECSITGVHLHDRRELRDMPILMAAEIGGRIYKAEVSLTDVFGMEPLLMSSTASTPSGD